MKYEEPILIDLALGSTNGSADCSGGQVATSYCAAGGSAGLLDYCTAGVSNGTACSAGTIASNACTAGVSLNS